jgi:hypothetical protein
MYKDILRDTEIYQLIMQEGEEKEARRLLLTAADKAEN